MTTQTATSGPVDALSAYALTQPYDLRPIDSGLINKTYLLTCGDGRFVVQALHPIFKAELHHDIEAITAHLQARGLLTPRLVRTTTGDLNTVTPDGVVWRVMTFIDGVSHPRMQSTHMAEQAGALVGRFHAALSDLTHTFHFTRPGVHDLRKHVGTLQTALDTHTAHRYRARIAPLAERIIGEANQLTALPDTPKRIAHGDLKVSNLLFDAQGQALCLVDLDTLAHMPLAFELGDAWRSWCNTDDEDVSEPQFRLDFFIASAHAYLTVSRSWITPVEIETFVLGTRTIALELSSRFLTDALNENYFGWNPARFADRSTHNFVRASGQFALYQSLSAQAYEAERALKASR